MAATPTELWLGFQASRSVFDPATLRVRETLRELRIAE